MAARAIGGRLTVSDAAGAAMHDLLASERELRALAEESVRGLRGALRLVAYTFAGEAFEAAVRANRAVEMWSGEEWIAFFQRVAPTSRGWADPAVLAERLRQVTGERDVALAEVRRLQEDLALRAELIRSGVAQARPKTADVNTDEQAAQQEPVEEEVGYTAAGFRWPKIPAKPPRGYTRLFSKQGWVREKLALALVAMGLSLRIEAVGLLARRVGTKPSNGSLKDVFERLVDKEVMHNEVLQVGGNRSTFVWLSPLGKEICAACGFPVRESEFLRTKRLHQGGEHEGHTVAMCIFAFQARRRGYLTEMVPQVEGPAAPDVAIVARGGTRTYVEVELNRRKESKWRNMAEFQGFVALCALNPEARAALVSEVKALRLPGRATDLDTLYRNQIANDRGREALGDVWLEEWE